MDDAGASPQSEPSSALRRSWGIVAAVVVALVIGGLVGVAIASRGNDGDDASRARTTTTSVTVGPTFDGGTSAGGSPSASQSSQLANIEAACGRWMATRAGADRSGSWCSEMAGWMAGRTGSGQMMGTMMWGDPEDLAASCRQWSSGNDGWCDQMVDWMRSHMSGGWDHSMMDGW